MEYLSGGNNNDTLSAEYLFQGNLDEIDNTTFTPMLLSTIICPQYLRGGGGLWSSSCVSIIPAVPIIAHRHSSKHRHHISSSPYTHRHTAEKQRHIIASSYVLSSYREHKQHKMYYLCITHIVIYAATRCISTLCARCIWPQKGHSPFASTYLEDILDTSCTYLGHALQPWQ